ncbi:hypothetical protein M0R45_032297 [Rubus argutus]|uniref:Uncharacterized protein n=1 Tax=Rubus argutus TaxID=59490 RepID=A0AAW1WG42_RUBAR
MHGTFISTTAAGNYVDEVPCYGGGTSNGTAPRAMLAVYNLFLMELMCLINISIHDDDDDVPLFENTVAMASFSAMKKRHICFLCSRKYRSQILNHAQWDSLGHNRHGRPKDKFITIYVKNIEIPTITIEFHQSFTYVGSGEQYTAAFASRGRPSRSYPNILKPDIIAPGVYVIGGWTPKQPIAHLGPLPFYGRYAMKSGTSTYYTCSNSESFQLNYSSFITFFTRKDHGCRAQSPPHFTSPPPRDCRSDIANSLLTPLIPHRLNSTEMTLKFSL